MKKRMISFVLIVIMLSNIGFNVMAAPLNNTSNFKKVIEEFEEELKNSGYEYAKENNLIMSTNRMDYMVKEINFANSIIDKKNIAQKYDKYNISVEKIFEYNPNLKAKAKEILANYPQSASYLNIYTNSKPNAKSSPNYGDYRENLDLRYSKRKKVDTCEANSFSALQTILIGIITLGKKPAASIAITVLSAILGSDKFAKKCTNYEVISSSHTCLQIKWGEIYSSGGLLGDDKWIGYVESQRSDTYSDVKVEAWYENKYKSNTKSALLKYEWNKYFNNSNFLKTTAKKLYAKELKDGWTDAYGVGVVIPEYHMDYHSIWVSTADNPFE